MTDTTVTYASPSVHRAFALLRHIASGERCYNVSQVAKDLKINRTTLIRLLHTLETEGMIEPTDTNGGWQLGLGMVTLAAESLKSRDVVRLAQPVMMRLAATLGLSVHLGVLEQREVVYLLRETPNSHLISNIREGSRLPAHATTVGRILLAHSPWEEVAKLYQNTQMTVYTGHTPTTMDALKAQLARDKSQGYAWSEAGFERGIGACAAAIFNHRSRAVAALNVTGPVQEFSEQEPHGRHIQTLVKHAALEISALLGYAA